MKKRVVVLLVLVVVGLSFFLSGVDLTGMTTAGPLITLSSVEVFKNNAVIRWSTSMRAESTVSYGDNILVFDNAQSFEATLENLESATKYRYTIEACADKCTRYSGSFTTGEPAPPITGNSVILQLGTVNFLKNSVGSLFLALVVITAVVITANIAYNTFGELNLEKVNLMPAKARFNYLLRAARRDLEDGIPEEAFKKYERARQLYEGMGYPQKKSSYDSLIALYRELSLHHEKREVDQLAEKYASGTITQNELQRLRELLSQ